ncbi:MAG: hypothetical protein QOG93_293, partial [Gaiellaceae bacterium]|nr:hypothetical protein [Gaiellaceae bacterium]
MQKASQLIGIVTVALVAGSSAVPAHALAAPVTGKTEFADAARTSARP